MSRPMPPDDGVPAYDPAGTGPVWTAPAPPSWTQGWPPPGQAPAPVPAPVQQRTARATAGARRGWRRPVCSRGRAAMGSQLSEELARTLEDVSESLLVDPYGLGEGAGTGALGPVEEFPPVAPAALGPIPLWTSTR